MPSARDPVGERLSSLESAFASFEKYEHDRWHKLANDLQPLIGLPVQMARDIGKLQGGFDGRIATITKEIERSITAAVEKAIEPVNQDITVLKGDVEELKRAKLHDDGAKGIVSAIFKSPLIAWLIVLAGVVWAIVTGRAQP